MARRYAEDDYEDESSESSSDSEDDLITLFHYTDKQSARQIKRTKIIKRSKGRGNAAFGSGVYMTKLDLSKSPIQVAENNYDDGAEHWLRQIFAGKLEYAVKVTLKSGSVKRCTTKRSVYLYKGNLKLSETNKWEIVKRKSKNMF